jgi:hypothetical protein
MRCDVTPYDFVKVIPDELYSLNLHLTFSWILRVPVHGLITHDVTLIHFSSRFQSEKVSPSQADRYCVLVLRLADSHVDRKFARLMIAAMHWRAISRSLVNSRWFLDKVSEALHRNSTR